MKRSRSWRKCEGIGKVRVIPQSQVFINLLSPSSVAFKRFADYVALAIDTDYIRFFNECLDGALREHLKFSGHGASARCAGYLAQPKDVMLDRDEMTARLRRLENAAIAIAGL